MQDPFRLKSKGLELPCTEHFEITPSANYLSKIPRCLYVLVSGDVVIEDSKGVQVTYSSVPVGIFPFRPVKVRVGTTATVVGWQ